MVQVWSSRNQIVYLSVRKRSLFALIGITIFTALPATAENDITVNMDPIPEIRSNHGNFSLRPTGRIHIDNAFFNDDKTDHPDDHAIRRFRVGFIGTVNHNFTYKMDVEFGNKLSGESAEVKDGFIAYTGNNYVNIRAGNFRPASGLEKLTSSNHITFIERSLPTNVFETPHILGIQAYGGNTHYSWALGLHNDNAATKSNDDEATSVTGRLTYAPLSSQGRVLHFGVSDSYQFPDQSTDSVSFSATAENSIQTKKSAATGNISNVDAVNLFGLEAAGVYQNFSLQGEYFITSIKRESVANLAFHGWYLQSSWFLTGESRNYNARNGAFGRITPTYSFDLNKNHWGAWELAARYSNLDLNDNNIQGGNIKNLTLGLNWHLNPHARLMANYISTHTDNVTPSGSNVAAGDSPDTLLLRAQIDF